MTETYSYITRNTSYHSDNGQFSSMSKGYVEAFENGKFDIKTMTKGDVLYWSLKGNLRV